MKKNYLDIEIVVKYYSVLAVYFIAAASIPFEFVNRYS